MGLPELRACQSLLVQAMMHLLKLHLWPDEQAVAHWRGEVATFLASARRAFTPSMRQRLVMADLYADALYGVRAAMEADTPAIALPEDCPFTSDDLLAGRPDVAALVARLAAPGV